VIALCACAPATASAAAWLPQTVISDPIPSAGFAQEPWVASNATGDVVAAWSTQTGSEYETVRASVRLAGGAWGPPKTLSDTAQSGGRAQVALSPSGEAVAIWSATVGGFSLVQTSTRPPGGDWSARQTISSPSATADDARVRMDGQGNAVAAWFDTTNDQVKVRTRSGGAWGSIQSITSAGTSVRDVQLAVGGDGTAVLAWAGSDGANQRVRVATREPGGASFSAGTVLSPAGANPDEESGVAVDPAGNRYVIWGSGNVPQVASAPPGGSFTAFPDLDTAAGVVDDPALVIDGQLAVTAIWGRCPGSGNCSLQAAAKPPGGGWTTPQTLAPVSDNVAHPSLVITPQGDAIATWMDIALSGPVNTLVAAVRSKGGAWSSAQTVATDAKQDPRLAADGLGDATAIWYQDTGTETKLVSRIYDGAPPRLDNLQIPATSKLGEPAAFSVAPSDVWSAVTATDWDFGDGQVASGTNVSHTYVAGGHYTVKVSATDAAGNTATASSTLDVPVPPVVETKLVLGQVVVKGTSVSFTLACQAAAGKTCLARADLTTLEKLLGTKVVGLSAKARKRFKRKRALVGSTVLTLHPGEQRVVKVPLNATGKKLLAKFRRLPATLKVTLLGPPPTVVKTTKVTFTAKKKAPKKAPAKH
jgi:hypothetical protein